jgi:hypothetical protein
MALAAMWASGGQTDRNPAENRGYRPDLSPGAAPRESAAAAIFVLKAIDALTPAGIG